MEDHRLEVPSALSAPYGEELGERIWNLEAIYDEQIAPHMEEIIRVCKENDLPFVASFEYANEEFCSSALVPDEAATMLHQMRAAIQASRTPASWAYTITTTRNES